MTYSIVARDPDSGQMGVAAQSQAFAVGSSVSWALPGHGVIATQSIGEPMYGELGLEVLRSGLTASEALTALRTVDPHPERRQVAMVDGRGRVDVYTGEACVAEAGHCVGDGCAALGNMMATPGAWDAMIETFGSRRGALAERLIDALRAAEAEGGDVRGRRSAAILVVCAEPSGRPWQDQVVDLRVDDHPEPVEELARMVTYNDRYHRIVEAFELALEGAASEALERLEEQPPVAADEPDFVLWRSLVLAQAGHDEEAARLLGELADAAPRFVEVARRFGPAGLVAPELLDRILPTEG